MTEGPPPSDAGPSGHAVNPTFPLPRVSNFINAASGQGYPYYNYQATWANPAWQQNAYQYGAQYQQPFPQGNPFPTPQYQPYISQPQTPAPTPSQTQTQPVKIESISVPESKPKPRTPSPPPPELPRYWDAAVKTFLASAGLTQALKGFEADMLVMSAEWEQKEVPLALEQLARCLSKLLGETDVSHDSEPERPFEQRKLDYMHLENGATPRSQTSVRAILLVTDFLALICVLLRCRKVNKSISLFLARNRARNDASNRNEFLIARKRRRIEQLSDGDATPAEESASCARTDAKTIDRDVMMKFDIARNEEGPLRRTIKTEDEDTKSGITANGAPLPEAETADRATAQRHPGLDHRLRNIETHVAVRYVPSPPVSLVHRIKFIEDHIVNLEREYPPWAALHFNQPRRGVRTISSLIYPNVYILFNSGLRPLVLPPSLSHPTSRLLPLHQPLNRWMITANPHLPCHLPLAAADVSTLGKAVTDAKGKARQMKSSLHRAVMERLEVQRAMSDLRGENASS
ncbi:hypothetical protein EVG20_g3138 [Dentipellis fragilis]|uniref:Uncharacterized protein n=1 Tax=Dentipellis fragilis TaxID=205917 RepID=A0A4Y9Z805_9AGAM|nr:hypothetical protein EVG20_g3138 [Dentipellis fragilis]